MQAGEDPMVLVRFYIRKSQLERARRFTPNRGDLSELGREGFELALARREASFLRYQQLLHLPPTSQPQPPQLTAED